jgi:serine/threonine protein kinase
MKKTFVEKYTCIAQFIDEDGSTNITRILQYPGNIFKNTKGDLKNADVLKELKVDPLTNLRIIYNETLYFLSAIHCANIYYGDMKCSNIFMSKKNNVIIGDYGSLRRYTKKDSTLNQYWHTFKTPCHDSFVEYWIKDKGSKLNFVKEVNKYDPNIFSEKNLTLVLKNWNQLNVLQEPDEDNYEENYDDGYDNYMFEFNKFFAGAVDYFHFGIAMIELIILLKDATLYPFINIIFKYFCKIPMMIDIDYPFEMLECLLHSTETILSTKSV